MVNYVFDHRHHSYRFLLGRLFSLIAVFLDAACDYMDPVLGDFCDQQSVVCKVTLQSLITTVGAQLLCFTPNKGIGRIYLILKLCVEILRIPQT